MNRTADLLTVRTLDDNGTDIPRFTNFRALIALADASRFGSHEVDLRIVADDAHAEANGHGDDPELYVWQASIPAADVSNSATDMLADALGMLRAEGFEVSADSWVRTDEGMVSPLAARLAAA
jgi:hypothetical protein